MSYKLNVADLKNLYSINQKEPLSRLKIQKLTDCSTLQSRIIQSLLANFNLIKEFILDKEDITSTVKTTKTQDAKGNYVLESPVSSTVDELLERFQIDPEYWKVTRSVINEWGSYDNPNRQAKAWLERIGDIVDWDTFKKEFIENVKQHSPEIPKIQHKYSTSGKLQEISIYDLHLGKLAWHEESPTNYDSKIARDRFYAAIDKLIRAGEKELIEQIVFPVGNDLFNSDRDYPFPQTTAGTPQEADIRWQRSWRIVRQMVIDTIERLKQIAPVHIVVVSGNHDFQKSFYLGDLLEVKYENDENVTVDNSPSTRKYFQWGKILLGYTHGKDTPYNRLLQLMPQEEPMKWAATKFREWHLGHTHTGKKLIANLGEDIGGITIRHFRTLMSGDSWESQRGYFSLGGAETLFWDKTNGLASISYFNL